MVYDSIPQISISNNECADSGLITLVDTLSLNLIKKKNQERCFQFLFLSEDFSDQSCMCFWLDL